MARDGSTSGTEQYQPCQRCGEPVNTLEPNVWKAPNDEQWWHPDCYDKVEKVEEIRERLLGLIIPEGEHDGYSDDFYLRLDSAQSVLAEAIDREELKRDQGLGPYSTDTDQNGGATDGD